MSILYNSDVIATTKPRKSRENFIKSGRIAAENFKRTESEQRENIFISDLTKIYINIP